MFNKSIQSVCVTKVRVRASVNVKRSHILKSVSSLFYSTTTKFDIIFYKTKEYSDITLYMGGKIGS